MTNSLTGFDETNFSMDLSFDEVEYGDDGNGSSTKITIRDKTLNYGWTYSGYHPSEELERERSFTITLSDAELAEIQRLIEEAGMWREVNETQEIGDIGQSIEISLLMQDGSRSVQSYLYGMEWQLSTREGNIENRDFMNEVQVFINLVNARVGQV